MKHNTHDDADRIGPPTLETSNPVLNCLSKALKALRGKQADDVTIIVAFKVAGEPFDWEFEGSVPVLFEMLARIEHMVHLTVDDEEGIGIFDDA